MSEQQGKGELRAILTGLAFQYGPTLLRKAAAKGLRNPRTLGTAGVLGGGLIGLGLLGKLLFDKAQVRRDRQKAAADREGTEA